MQIISVSNQKGGVGKTTTATNLASGLSSSGKRVLLIDLDPQASATKLANIEFDLTMHDALSKDERLSEIAIKADEGYDFIPASLELTNTEIFLNSEIAGERILGMKLNEVSDEYDYVVLDTPPNLGLLSLSALVAANLVLIPVKPARLDVVGLRDMLQTISKVQARLNPNLELKVLVTMYDARKNISKKYTEALQEMNGLPLFDTKINMNTDIEKAQTIGQSVIHYNPRSTGAMDYQELVREVIENG